MLKKIAAKIKKFQYGRNLLILLAVFGVGLALYHFDPVKKVSAAPSDTVSGWAWSSNIGWISFNCTTDTFGCFGSNYGVNLDVNTGNMSGYAWSSNIGWIKFDSSLTGPLAFGANRFGAKVDMNTGKIKGWARACAVFAPGCSGTPKAVNGTELGGWDGWISFDCTDGSTTNPPPKNACTSQNNYGVSFNKTTGDFSGFAWGGGTPVGAMPVGWINFNCATDPNGCGGLNYFVKGPISSSTCSTNIAKCPLPTLSLQVKDVNTITYGKSVSFPSVGGNVDLKWTTTTSRTDYPLTCTFTSTPSGWAPTASANGTDTEAVTVTKMFDISCDDGYHTPITDSVTVAVGPVSQAISQVILEAKDSSGSTFSMNNINIPSSPGKIDLQWRIIYTNPNNAGLDVVCDGNSNPNPWVNWFLATPPVLNNHVYTTAGTTNATVSGPSSIPFNLTCYDTNTPNVTVSSNVINVSFGPDPIVYLDIKDDSKPADPFTKVVNLPIGGGDVDFKLQGSNINFCTASSTSSGAEDSNWKAMTVQINNYLGTNPNPIVYPQTPPAKINVTKSTTFGIQCQETPPGTKISTPAQVQVWVNGIKPPTLSAPKPKYIFF